MNDDTVSAIARGVDGINIAQFMRFNGVLPDWSNCEESGVKAFVSGMALDNSIGSQVIANGEMNSEQLVHLVGPKYRCVVNLATMLALAATHAKSQQEAAEEAFGVKRRAHVRKTTRRKKESGRR